MTTFERIEAGDPRLVRSDDPTTALGHLAAASVGAPEALAHRDDVVAFVRAGAIDQPSTQLEWYRNLRRPGSIPSAPIPLAPRFGPTGPLLRWEPAPDHASNGCTFHVRVGSAPGLSDVLNTGARADGSRYILAHDVKLLDLSHFTAQQTPGRTGIAAIVDDARRAIVLAALEELDADLVGAGLEGDLAANARGLAHRHRHGWNDPHGSDVQLDRDRHVVAGAVPAACGAGHLRGDQGGGQLRRQPDMVEPPAAVGSVPVPVAVRPPGVQLLRRRHDRPHRVDVMLAVHPGEGGVINVERCQRVDVVEDPASSGDQVVLRCALAVPPGVRVAAMGTQNIKGTGLDFVYRWIALDAASQALAQLQARDPQIRRAALLRLESPDDPGLLDAGLVARALAVRRPAAGEAELQGRAQARAQERHAARRTALGHRHRRGRAEAILGWLEGFVDFLDGARRYRRAREVMHDLVTRRISHARAAQAMRELDARAKGGWLAKSLRRK